MLDGSRMQIFYFASNFVVVFVGSDVYFGFPVMFFVVRSFVRSFDFNSILCVCMLDQYVLLWLRQNLHEIPSTGVVENLVILTVIRVCLPVQTCLFLYQINSTLFRFCCS